MSSLHEGDLQIRKNNPDSLNFADLDPVIKYFVRKLLISSDVDAIILFGSFVRGIKNPGDVDFFVVCDTPEYFLAAREWYSQDARIPLEYNGKIPTNLDLDQRVNAFDEPDEDFMRASGEFFGSVRNGSEPIRIITLAEREEKYRAFSKQFPKASLLLVK